MRKDWRNYIAPFTLGLTEVALIVFACFIYRPAGHLYVAILLAFLIIIAANWNLLRLRRMVTSAKTDAATAAEIAELAHTQALDAIRESMAASINATIVEIVAAQQAVVRAAHPDDILLRLTSAEDSAHAALTATAPELAKIGATAGQSG
jgi:hypothetical protein